jgi:hypothetical protein
MSIPAASRMAFTSFKGSPPRRIAAYLVAEKNLDLPFRDIAKTTLQRGRYQRRETVRSQRDPEQNHGYDRCRRGQRPPDNGANAPTTRKVFIELGAARGQFRGHRGVMNLQPRQCRRRQAA